MAGCAFWWMVTAGHLCSVSPGTTVLTTKMCNVNLAMLVYNTTLAENDQPGLLKPTAICEQPFWRPQKSLRLAPVLEYTKSLPSPIIRLHALSQSFKNYCCQTGSTGHDWFPEQHLAQSYIISQASKHHS